jgi:metal-sulfur cluster biosynthetic enzyme
MEIGGNIQGLKKSIIQSLKDLYDIEIPQNMLWTRRAYR